MDVRVVMVKILKEVIQRYRALLAMGHTLIKMDGVIRMSMGNMSLRIAYIHVHYVMARTIAEVRQINPVINATSRIMRHIHIQHHGRKAASMVCMLLIRDRFLHVPLLVTAKTLKVEILK
jgi:hypothetical protein